MSQNNPPQVKSHGITEKNLLIHTQLKNMGSSERIIKKIICIFLIFLFNTPTNIKSHIPPIIGLHNVLQLDDIGLGQSLLHSKFVKNIYLYAPKEDPLRIVARTLWHIFWGAQEDQMLDTKKGPLAAITPAIFGRIMQYVYTNPFNDAQLELVTRELLQTYEWPEKYKDHLPEEIKAVRNVTNLLKKELTLMDMQTKQTEETLRATIEKLQETNIRFKQAVSLSKKEKSIEIQAINKTMKKKSPEKRRAIQAVVKKIDKKYQIHEFKTIKKEINEEIETLKQKVRKLQKSKNNILNEQKNKKVELSTKIYALEHEDEIQRVVENTIKDLVAKIRHALSSDLYPPRIAIGLLWAFFESKHKTITALQECLHEVKATIPSNKKYEQNTYKDFEQEINDLQATSQLKKIEQDYDRALHSLIQRVKSGAFPPQINMEKIGYEHETGKITDKFPDCFESSLLDFFSILWYNPVTEQYNSSLFSPTVRSGIGFKKLQHMLQTIHLAEKIKLPERTYTLRDGFTEFTSFHLLKKQLAARGFFQENIETVKLSDISAQHICHPALRQEWVNALAHLETIAYHQPEKQCELLPTVQNFIHALNFFYSTDATQLSDFNTLLSYENRKQEFTRTISFELLQAERTTIIAHVHCVIKKVTLDFTIKLHMMAHHSYIDLPERNTQQSSVYKTELAKLLANKLHQSAHTYHPLTPFFILLAKKELLNTQTIENPKFIRLLYYSLNLTDPQIQLAVAKHALHNNLLQHKDIKRLVLRIKEMLKTDPQKEYQCIAHIIQSKAYQQHQVLHEYLLQNPSKTLGVIANIKIERPQLNDLYKILIQKKADINARWEPDGDALLHKTIKEDYQDIAQSLVAHRKTDINKTGKLKRTALHMAAIIGNIPIMSQLLKHRHIKVNEKDYQNCTPLHLACTKDNQEVVQYLLNHPKVTIGEKNTPLHAAAMGGHSHIFNFLFKHIPTYVDNTDENHNTPLHIAAYYGHDDIAKIILNISKKTLNQPGYKQRTPLNIAAKNGNQNVVDFLLSCSTIDINLPDNKTNTPLNRAVKKEHVSIVQSLLAHPHINVNITDNTKETPLNWAAYAGKLHIVKEILKNPYVNVNKANNHGKTPLYWATTKGFVNVVKQLLQHKKIKINKANMHGKTPLNRACYKGHIGIINTLLQHKKIKVNKQCAKGKTPLDVAKNDTVRKMLLAHGATSGT